MKLAIKLAWEYRWSWIAMLILTAASALVLVIVSHVSWANDIISAETGNATLKIDVAISFITTLLIVQTIAVLCLESQARDLAIIKTCGAAPKAIRKTLLGEIVVVTVVGFLIGTVVALPFITSYTTWAVGVSTGAMDRTFGYNLGSFVTAAIALFAAVLLGSLATIRRVSNQNVVSALQGETVGNRRRKRFLGATIGWLAILSNVIVVVVALNAEAIVGFVTSFASQSGADELSARQMIGTAEGAVVLMPAMLFVLGCMIIAGAFAPKLYRWILSKMQSSLPKNAPGWLEVGVKQASFNATKYYGSITPMVIFVLAIVLIFSVLDSSVSPIKMLYAQHGVTILEDQSGANYDSVTLLIGPALFIAFVGSLVNIMMSGRGRIFVHKLTSILGIKRRQLFLQALAEMASYACVAAIIGLFALLVASSLVWIVGNSLTNFVHPFIVAWPAFSLSVLFIMLVMSAPAIISVYRSRQLPNKQVLESFGE